MRIWSLHPKYLDAKGLVALWRETLLAQSVLQGMTRGYRNHPQLDRFKKQIDPVASVAAYLVEVSEEAERRGYEFDSTKISPNRARGKLQVTRGQISYEWEHLRTKLTKRDPLRLAGFTVILNPEPHPLFTITEGDIESWEKT